MQTIKRKYITGIDGLRTIAVLGVIGYHLLPEVFKGGYLGVTLFFVISGYLMTDILYQQWQTHHHILLKSFYKKRLKRLMPSLLVMLIVSGAILVWLPGDFLNHFRGVVVSSLTYTNNWWQLHNGVSYFQQFGQAMPFVHLWSLSVEGQFYLIWPICMGLIFASKPKAKTLWWGMLGLSVVSAIEMAILYNPQDLNRVYYGTDTRLFSILIGCALAIFLRANEEKLSQLSKTTEAVFGFIALLLMISCFFFISDSSVFVYRGGMYLFSLACAFLLGMVIVSPLLNNYLSNKFFYWCGTRSYEIYLWQYPILIAYENVMKLDGTNRLLHVFIEVLLVVIFAELTYRFVQWFPTFIQALKTKTYMDKKRAWTIIVALGLCCVSFIYAFVSAPSTEAKTTDKLQQTLNQKEKAIKKPKKVKMDAETEAQIQQLADASQTTAVPLTVDEIRAVHTLKVTAVGDSVLLDAAPDLQKYIPDMQVDAQVGRQLNDSVQLIKDKKANGELGDVVIIALGTNGSFKWETLQELLKPLKGKKVFLVNTIVPKVWQKDVNDTLAKAARTYSNVYLVNWNQLGAGQTGWFYKDGTHMNKEGSQVYANNVIKVIAKHLNNN